MLTLDKTTARTDWIDLGCDTGADHVFAIGDVHGQDKALRAAYEVITQCVSPGRRRHLVHLGDLLDRGPGSLPAMRMACKADELAEVDENTILPGNHELMLMTALTGDEYAAFHWAKNGGFTVINEVLVENQIEAGNIPSEFGDFRNMIRKVIPLIRKAIPSQILDMDRLERTHLKLGDLLFVHAGLNPEADREEFLARGNSSRFGYDHWAWIREEFLYWEKGWDQEGREIVVHGHTPCLREWVWNDADLGRGPLQLDRRRICLDGGAAYKMGQVLVGEFLDGKARIHAAQVGRPYDPSWD